MIATDANGGFVNIDFTTLATADIFVISGNVIDGPSANRIRQSEYLRRRGQAGLLALRSRSAGARAAGRRRRS
jgi:hypothetical protein